VDRLHVHPPRLAPWDAVVPRPPIVVRRGSARILGLASLDFRIFGKAKAPPAVLLSIQRSSRLPVRSAPCRRAYSGSLTAVTPRSTHEDRLKQMTVAHGALADCAAQKMSFAEPACSRIHAKGASTGRRRRAASQPWNEARGACPRGYRGYPWLPVASGGPPTHLIGVKTR
jgi:hypothetical protein